MFVSSIPLRKQTRIVDLKCWFKKKCGKAERTFWSFSFGNEKNMYIYIYTCINIYIYIVVPACCVHVQHDYQEYASKLVGIHFLGIQFWDPETRLALQDHVFARPQGLTGGVEKITQHLHNVGISKNRGTPKSSILMGFFHYKPSILGYPYFRKHPCRACKLQSSARHSSSDSITP